MTIGPSIFKRASTGAIHTWHYEVDGSRWRTHHGVYGGTLVISEWTSCTAKSQPTDEDQAQFEAEAEHRKKLARDYRETLDTIDTVGNSIIRPMLAQKFEGADSLRGCADIFTQPKLDGVRCIANRFGLWSRQDKPFVSVPHIAAALQPIFEKDPYAIFDGELYNHDLRADFNKIVSVVKKQKPTPEDLERSAALIQYHIYDAPSIKDCFNSRRSFIERVIPDDAQSPLRRVPTYYVANQYGKLDDRYAEFLAAGYEGQMIRISGPYEQKRSKLLLKRKEFHDREFPVDSIEEGQGNWAGYAKRAILRLDDGRTFGAGISGPRDYCQKLLGTKPTIATVRYFALTPDGVPRFPVAIAFYDGDRP